MPIGLVWPRRCRDDGIEAFVVTSPIESSNAKGVNGSQADTSALGSGAAYIFTK